MSEKSEDLLIPFGVNNAGELVDPRAAIKGESYLCPACHSLLILRQGTMRVFHFAHKADCVCNQETVIHKTAKMLIRQVIEDWKKGDKHPRIMRSCASCGSMIGQLLPDKVELAQEEYRVGNFIVDVALMAKGSPLAAIEIRVTHAVEEGKEGSLPLPFIELKGEEVIEDPYHWVPLIDKFNPLTCEECKEEKKRIFEISNQSNVKFEKDFFIPAIIKCWKCKKEILVFSWPNHGIFPKRKPHHEPFPRTLQFRFSKTQGEKYWANTCPYCLNIQGDHFLFNEQDGPFFENSFGDFGYYFGPLMPVYE